MAARKNAEFNVDESLKGLFLEQSRHQHQHQMNGGDESRMIDHDDGGEGFKADMRGFEKMMLKLNPVAQDIVPCLVADANTLVPTNSSAAGDSATLKKSGSTHREQKAKGKGKAGNRICEAQRDEVTKTVYVSDIDNQITEEQLAALFATCGKLVDCLICGSPESVLRSALVEFTDEESARNALSLAGTILGSHNIRVLLLKTQIPIQPTLLPSKKSGSSHGEQKAKGKGEVSNRICEAQRNEVTKTVYVSDIDNQISEEQLAALFATCGKLVDCLICGSPESVLRFAFVEFIDEESARNALSLAGAMLGSHTIRVLLLKTEVAPVQPTPLPSKKSGSSHREQKAKGKASNQTSSPQRKQVTRTVYVYNIGNQTTEEQLAALFATCGKLVDCLICGSPESVLRSALVEFTDEESARNALSLAGTMLGSHTIGVQLLKTEVAPVQSTLLPSKKSGSGHREQKAKGKASNQTSSPQREQVRRTVYVYNIDNQITEDQLAYLFATCGQLVDCRICAPKSFLRFAFVEFTDEESARNALSLSGTMLGSHIIRVLPSTTAIAPVKPLLLPSGGLITMQGTRRTVQ